MGIAPYVRRLRDSVGHELLLLPAVAVLPRDERGRLLLMQSMDTRQWQAIGGAVDPDESPQDAALREAAEEAGIELRLGEVLAVLGGPQYRWTYPNGDEVAYVTVVFGATVVGGTLQADGDEALAVEWWEQADLGRCDMNSYTRTLLGAVGLPTQSTLA